MPPTFVVICQPALAATLGSSFEESSEHSGWLAGWKRSCSIVSITFFEKRKAAAAAARFTTQWCDLFFPRGRASNKNTANNFNGGLKSLPSWLHDHWPSGTIAITHTQPSISFGTISSRAWPHFVLVLVLRFEWARLLRAHEGKGATEVGRIRQPHLHAKVTCHSQVSQPSAACLLVTSPLAAAAAIASRRPPVIYSSGWARFMLLLLLLPYKDSRAQIMAIKT